ncbi:MAG: aldehyde dehydrogenase (NADP(+)) [Deltaproteobacteria bacterium]|nr:aldehyde dehydrogenase (NADP(+)) [Deltaproteobacteria bacterium]
MTLNGQHILAEATGNHPGAHFYAVNPVTAERLQPAFVEGTAVQVDIAARSAEHDFSAYRQLSLPQRADFLVAITTQLRKLEADLLERAGLETGLPRARLAGELTRTVNQLLMFADFVREGAFLQPQIVPALPERQPLPRSDLRLTQVPLGPVAVFGASNFPLAFSVAGGDTAAALAAGCPVVVKAHPAHPGTCELAGRAIRAAGDACGLPRGVFSLLQGSGKQLGAALVEHPLISAVAFTGSQAGGRALFNLAAARPEPIPVFAEMGSVNPVFLLPRALADGGAELARKYVDSVALGVGQFCTNPGLLFVLNDPALESFIHAVEEYLPQLPAAAMLHRGIKQNYCTALDKLVARSGVELRCGEIPESDDCFVSPALLRTTAEQFLVDSKIAEEVFGPASVIVVCQSFLQMQQCAAALAGQLTAAVHAMAAEEEMCRELLTLLERKAGRLVMNDFPTGVEVCHAMVHGGPYPATTDSRTTSVGSEAIRRFLRPLCRQNFPTSLLPEELQD